jgi:hypothetical protein
MATRALVGFIMDGPKLISTYNHYDGYPDSLGVALDKFYSMPEEALKVASMGYISFIDPETGDIEAKHKEPADKTPLGNDFEEGMMKVAQKADSYGADYIYIYNVEEDEWIHVALDGTRKAAEELAYKLQDYDGGIFPEPTRDLPAAPDQFDNDEANTYASFSRMGEGSRDNDVVADTSVSIRDAEAALKGEHGPHVKVYIDSLANDIRLNGDETYADFDEADWKEDFTEYIADKLTMEQYTKDQWQYRAGIKK